MLACAVFPSSLIIAAVAQAGQFQVIGASTAFSSGGSLRVRRGAADSRQLFFAARAVLR
jgi:hypothetical protein